jgi:hypothetical protein
MKKQIQFIIILIISATGYSGNIRQNDTFSITRTITEVITYGYSRSDSSGGDISVRIEMNWTDTSLPRCSILRFFKYGKDISRDTSTTISMNPKHAGEIGGMMGIGILKCSTKDLVISDKNGNIQGYGYDDNIQITPSQTDEVQVQYNCNFHPWGHEKQQFSGDIVATKDTTIRSRVKYGNLSIDVKFLRPTDSK